MKSDIQEKKIITPLIDMFLAEMPEKERAKGFHPSSIYSCARKVYYSMKEYEKEKHPTATQQRTFAVGHKFEECYTEWFTEMDKETKKNPKKYNGFKLIGSNEKLEDVALSLKGEYDKIVEVDNIKYVIDIKSTKDGEYGWDAKPHLNYIIQVQLYMYMTGIHNGVLIYQNKNTHEQAEYHFEYSQEIIDKIKRKISYLKQSLKNNILPKREHRKEEVDCRLFCPYYYTCWGEKMIQRRGSK
jgi:hypothetical protein